MEKLGFDVKREQARVAGMICEIISALRKFSVLGRLYKRNFHTHIEGSRIILTNKMASRLSKKPLTYSTHLITR
jgi:hypothetical protein